MLARSYNERGNKVRVPVRLPARSKPVNESDIRREIMNFLRQTGKFALRLNSGKVRVRGGWMQLCPEGTPDIQVIERIVTAYECSTHVSWIETKDAKGKQREAQLAFQVECTRRGERYILARSLDDVLAALK
jgi:hypothetical protein